MDVTVYPHPNPAVTACLIGPQLRAIMAERGQTALMLYQAAVHKRSGRLAAAGHVSVEIGGADHDRWVAELVVGGAGGLGMADYAGAYLFGADVVGFGPDGERTRHENANAPHRDLNEVLSQLGSF